LLVVQSSLRKEGSEKYDNDNIARPKKTSDPSEVFLGHVR